MQEAGETTCKPIERESGEKSDDEEEIMPGKVQEKKRKHGKVKISLNEEVLMSTTHAKVPGENGRAAHSPTSVASEPASDGGYGVHKGEIYMDNAATTPLDPRVITVLMEELQQVGNPSSLHLAGERKKAKLGTRFISNGGFLFNLGC